MWITLFIISSLINVFAALYIRWLLRTLSSLGEELEDLAETVGHFSSHVGSLHELEMFYGDETLRSLMDHGKALVEKIDDIDFVLNVREEEAIDGEEEEKEE